MLVRRFISVMVFFVILASPAYSQEESSPTIFEEVTWLYGPSIASMEDLAEIRIPGGYVFANGEDTRLLMEALGNPPSNQEKGMYGPETMDWFVVFEFDEIGYIKDDEKSSLDAEAMLESIREGTEEANKYRRERGFTGLHILGWETVPHYDESTHNFLLLAIHSSAVCFQFQYPPLI